jgi:hypothetical protein
MSVYEGGGGGAGNGPSRIIFVPVFRHESKCIDERLFEILAKERRR